MENSKWRDPLSRIITALIMAWIVMAATDRITAAIENNFGERYEFLLAPIPFVGGTRVMCCDRKTGSYQPAVYTGKQPE